MSTTSIPFAISSDHTYLYSNTLTEQQREQYHRKQLNITCPECGAALMIVLSKNEYYFRHFSNQSCILDSNKIQKEYRDYLITQSHESEKHKFLKKTLMTKLVASDDPLIDKNTVCIEKYTEGRRADVYCERNDRKIAFEIQVSSLSLSIILARIDHYREKGIHLFWVIESAEFQKPQFKRDIENYGLSEHIYELSSDDKLLKCHFNYPIIYYENGSLSIKSGQRAETINLSDLYTINNQPALFDYEKEKENLKKLQVGSNPIFKENYELINEYLSWWEKHPNLKQINAFQAALIVDFFDYIGKFHTKDNYIHKDWGEPDDELTEPYVSFPCPNCQSMNRGYRGRFCLDKNQKKLGSCDYCDFKNIDLIQYIADMRYKGNKLKAAKKICHNLIIPYNPQSLY